jgi:hypothetical protein
LADVANLRFAYGRTGLIPVLHRLRWMRSKLPTR